ncbi:MAG: inorganic phosphate transporter [Chloroflexi bacterium]|nr:inorganic phosphate transporter [Chloroflexota bacterium]
MQLLRMPVAPPALLLHKSSVSPELTRSPWTGLALAGLLMLAFAATGAFAEYTLIAVIGLCLATWLSVENGGNDVSKGVAPIVAAGLARDRTAVVYGALVTLLGSLASLVLAQGLLALFTTGLIAPSVPITGTMVIAMAAGASAWVALATRFSLPVSTTHALVGAVVAVGAVSAGLAGVQWGNVGGKVVIPLLFSPAAGLAVAWLLTTSAARLRLRADIEGAMTWFTSGAICFVRAVNDTPKLAAIASLAAVLTVSTASAQEGNKLTTPFLLVAIAMAAGSVFKGLTVTQLLARNVTKLDRSASLGAPSAAAGLIMLASGWGLPVSTTHVSTSAIVGAGLSTNDRVVRWRVVRDIALSWLVTVPVAGLIGIGVYLIQVAVVPGAR